ncbi:MFP1 attachment factor 1 [Rhynchospora pubera]|uniref:MFP1 attachment factor 1 n=1 Tax=Rhynchospora pubera TaxID=906938 RepID=A0AAV8C594_9POAL|nr:MFP1 attachment factor 1 [Rhynchospora pubera]
MAETESSISDPPKPDETPKEETPSTTNTTTDSLSFNIWPPTNRTRDAVVRRLVETLTTDTVLSKRYGSVATDEAEISARSIEQEAFDAAHSEHASRFGSGSGSGSSSVEDGIEILQVYSKEVSRRMLEFAKSRAEKAVPTPAPVEAASE